MRNYCGVLVSREQYRTVFYAIEKKVVFNDSIQNDLGRERLWFTLGYSDCIIIIVARNNDRYDDLLCSGLVVDVRDRVDIKDARVAYDFVQCLMFSRSERIRLCNLIRNKLANRVDYRWCGSEMEAVVSKSIMTNSREIIGLRKLGLFVDLMGITQEPLPWVGIGDFSIEISGGCASLEDAGQKKLYSTFFAQIVRGATIVYVGASPGSGWLNAVRMVGEDMRLKVIAVDPRELDNSAPIPDFVTHVKNVVTSASDLLTHVDDSGNAVLIWDARSDFTDANKGEIVRRDIAILNGILANQELYKRFRLMHLKINTTNAGLYALPKGGRFFPQPFTLDRDVYETRYVWHHSGDEFVDLDTPSERVVNAIRTMLDNLKTLMVADGAYSVNQRLILNYLTSRVRTGDYLSLEPNFPILEEIFLFTLNHNAPERILLRLAKLKREGIAYFGSFFTGNSLCGDPFYFHEGEFLLQGLGVIFDSRSMINAKIEGLYFFMSDAVLTLYANELQTSETYLIRSSEFDLISGGDSQEYDEIRKRMAESGGKVFPKFPEIFSLADKLVSPSGHAFRVAMESISGNSSLGMLALKIIHNFRHVRLSNIRRFSACKDLVKMNESRYRELFKDDAITRKVYEVEKRLVWHSLEEWKLGLMAALGYRKNEDQMLASRFNSITEFLTKCIAYAGDGMEISNFLARNVGLGATGERARRSTASAAANFNSLSSAELFERFFTYASGNKTRDWARWSIRPDNDMEGMNLWHALVTKFRIDACGRDYFVHTAYMRALRGEDTRHDSSKTNWLEFILNVYGSTIARGEKFPHLLHFFNNNHHPEHSYLRVNSNGLQDRLEVMKTFNEIITYLKGLMAEVNLYETNPPDNYATDVDVLDYDEFLYDLIARSWQFDFANHRTVTKEQLISVSEKYFLRPFVNQIKLFERIEAFLLRDESVFCRLNAQLIAKSNLEWLYP